MDISNLPPWYPLLADKLKAVPACIRKDLKETILKSKQMENAVIAMIGSTPERKVVVSISEAHSNIAKFAHENGVRIGVSVEIAEDNDTVTISLEPPPKPNNSVPFIKPFKQ